MVRTGKPGHVDAALGHEQPGDGLTDPRHRRQPVRAIAKRAQHFVGLPLLVSLGTVLAAACEQSPVGPSPSRCRLYPLRMEVIGTPTTYDCELETGPVLFCQAGIFGPTRRGYYLSPTDFIDEGQPPGLRLRRTRFEARSGTLVSSSSYLTVTWTYDGQQRPVRQEDVLDVLGGPFTTVAVFTAWDGFGRPTRADVTEESETRAVDIVYGESGPTRTMNWSNGRSLEVDRDGNVVAEITPGGRATRFAIVETAELCE